MAASRDVTNGDLLQAADWNNLRADVLSETAGHLHDGTDDGGRKIRFADLDVSGTAGSTRPVSGTASYDEIEDHISGTGVHGLPANVRPIGSLNASIVVMYDTIAFSGRQENRLVRFPAEFSGTPMVFATVLANPGPEGDWAHDSGVVIRNVTSTSFVFTCNVVANNVSLTGINWMAIGPKTS